MKPHFSGHLTGRREEADEQLAEMVGPDAVEIVFALAPRLDESRNPQECQVMTDGRLALPEPVAQVGHMELAVLSEEEEDAKPGFIAEELEDLSKFADGLFGNLGHPLRGASAQVDGRF